jgi:glucose-6-phosphate dehydrogenase assembly protein OpcA
VAQAVVLDRWDGADVRLGEVIDNLTELRRSAARTASRTTVMTLVVVASTDDEAYLAQQAMHALGEHHPARQIVLRPEPDRGPVGVDARVTLYGARTGEHVITFDEVNLTVRGEAAAHLDSIIEPFTLADLPVVLWYPGALPDRGDPLLAIADNVLVDTKESGDARTFAPLSELARSHPVVDLSWERLRPWRELLAALFEGPVYRPFVKGITAIEVSGKKGPRHLLGGWLISRLDTDRSAVHLTDARHVRIVLYARARGRAGRFEVVREDHDRIIRAGATIEGGPHHDGVMPLPDDSLASSLASGLTHLRRDLVWEQAVATAVVLGE